MSAPTQNEPPVAPRAVTGRGVKIVQLVGMVLLCAGVWVSIANDAHLMTGALIAFLGLCLWLAGRFVAWWKYG